MHELCSRKRNAIQIKQLLYFIISIGLSAFAAFLLFGVILRPVIVSGNSMYPTLKNGDIIIVQQVVRNFTTGDIIVAHTDQSFNIDTSVVDSYIIKRIIGCPGDTLKINFLTNEVIKNGETLAEDYIYQDNRAKNATSKSLGTDPEVFGSDWHEYVVPKDCFFVMGDNRNNSLDSRSPLIGYIPEDQILGKAIMIF